MCVVIAMHMCVMSCQVTFTSSILHSLVRLWRMSLSLSLICSAYSTKTDRLEETEREREREREREILISSTHTQPLPVPDASSPSCMVKMAAAGVWVVYTMKV